MGSLCPAHDTSSRRVSVNRFVDLLNRQSTRTTMISASGPVSSVLACYERWVDCSHPRTHCSHPRTHYSSGGVPWPVQLSLGRLAMISRSILAAFKSSFVGTAAGAVRLLGRPMDGCVFVPCGTNPSGRMRTRIEWKSRRKAHSTASSDSRTLSSSTGKATQQGVFHLHVPQTARVGSFKCWRCP